ncbi:uncharacterized protein FA14DRAFT_177799 [Meira miltonrushii]|uniref:Uncharacterized protein n=1 Tax=Meira miltonrushii TaxID=1280837 RepID=A0A316VSP9_9BASI|nr:uncharacterized protein FA14DRAFT_177799 [Meira miltonrushii]PWN38535.1 hypothetical protein FA14DRAFT_177799 [Meira miltonrushii]
MHVKLIKSILTTILNLTLICRSLTADDPPHISLYGHLLDQPDVGTSEGTSRGSHPPMKISTARMKPVTSPGSPRLQAAKAQILAGPNKVFKGISHIAVSSIGDTQHLYPKVSVRPGRKDSTVLSLFRHPHVYPEGAKPYEYMQHQNLDLVGDVHQRAMIYKVGYRKIDDPDSEDIHHSRTIQQHMASNQYHPKAALVSTVPGDPRARRKGPKIDIDPGRLSGQILTQVYGPASPPKHGNPTHEYQGQPQGSGGAGRAHSPSHDAARFRSTSPGGSINPDNPISINAPLLNQSQESAPGGASSSSHGSQHLRFSTGRMKPVTSIGSPRVADAAIERTFGLSLKITDEELEKAKGTGHASPHAPSTSSQEPSVFKTHRMVASTGPSSPRLRENFKKIRNDNTASVKGISLTGVLKDKKSAFLYPKVTKIAGKERAYVLNLFHSPIQEKGIKPNMHMHFRQQDHPADLAQRASFYQIGHIKDRIRNNIHVKRVNEQIGEMKKDVFSPKAAMIHDMPANPHAHQKLPSIAVDGGKFDGNLISLVLGAPSPKGSKRKSAEPGEHAASSHQVQPDGTIDMLNRVDAIRCLTSNHPNENQSHQTGTTGRPTLSVDTSRMTPTTGLRSPRSKQSFDRIMHQEGQTFHSSAYNGVLADRTSKYLYPKVSVEAGRKSTNVVTMFQASGNVGNHVKPHFYRPYQRSENPKDIQQPASLYRIGTVKNNDHDAKAILTQLRSMHAEARKPKAVSFIKSPANKDALHKNPIVRIDPGTLHGNMVTMVYASDSRKQEKSWLKLGLPHGEHSQGGLHATASRQPVTPEQQASSGSSRPRKTTLNLFPSADEHRSSRTSQNGPAKKSKNA